MTTLTNEVLIREPIQKLAFELVTCSFPVTVLMTYGLKYKAVGRALDAVMLRRKWDQGIKAFLAGLKTHVETVRPHPTGV